MRRNHRKAGQWLTDWIRGGSYTSEPSDHNARLYQLERTPMLRRRIAGLVAIVVVLILGLPLWIVIYGVRILPEWLDAFKEFGGMIRTGRLV